MACVFEACLSIIVDLGEGRFNRRRKDSDDTQACR
jgi:hypothetical protein